MADIDPRVAVAAGAYAPKPKRSKQDEDKINAYLRKVGKVLSEPVRGYFARQGMLAREGLAMAEQGANQVRGGNVLEGGANMLLGPVGYLSSPINALLPTEQEVYSANDLPESAKPFVAGGLATAAAFLPGNKKGMGKPVSAADDAAEVAKIRERMKAFDDVASVPVRQYTPEELAKLREKLGPPPAPKKYEIPPMEDFLPRDRKPKKK